MRLILAGCEYAGTTTLVNAIVKPKSTEGMTMQQRNGR